MTLSILYPLIIALVAIFLLRLLTLLIKPSRDDSYHYRKQKVLFTAAERSFLGILDQAVGGQYRILGKVRIADVLTPEKGMTRKHWQIAFNKISSKHFDYVLCDKQTLAVVAAIELDDKSHKQTKTQQRDQLVEDACQTADLPLLRFDAKRSYHIETVRNDIQSRIQTISPQPEVEAIPFITASRES